MDADKLKKMEESVRIGGKGSMRRKHKNVPSSAAADEKRLQTALGKLPLKELYGIQEVSIEFDDSSEMVVAAPCVQGTTSSNLFVVSGDFVRKSSPNVAKASKPKAGSANKPESQEADHVVAEEAKKTKKPKKPRNRLRVRNKRYQVLLAEKNKESSELKDPMAGGDSEPKLSVAESIQNSSEDADDSNNGMLASGGSDVDKTLDDYEDSAEDLDDDSDTEDGGDDKEWNNLYSYSDDYDSQEEKTPTTSPTRVSEDED